VNSMHDSFTALGGFVPLFNIQLGEVIFGGVGAGLYGMLVFVVLAVFIAGLMVGRTPEYLGKKIEEYDGVVILATNFRRNMDDAFVRRMHFTVEFPFPDEADRLRIWQKIWPDATPRYELDLELMARRFEISGAAIRNVALSAAFLAASDGDRVGMQHLLHGARRECQKMGKVVAQHEFEIDELVERAL